MSNIWKDADLVGFLSDNINFFGDDSSKYFIGKSLFNSNDLAKDLALYFSTSSYYQCVKGATCQKSFEASSVRDALNADLNNSPASLPGALIKFNKSNVVYYYICSRNNNFSNRSQKGSITVS